MSLLGSTGSPNVGVNASQGQGSSTRSAASVPAKEPWLGTSTVGPNAGDTPLLQAEFEVELLTWMAFEQTANSLADLSQDSTAFSTNGTDGLQSLLPTQPLGSSLPGGQAPSLTFPSTQAWLDQSQQPQAQPPMNSGAEAGLAPSSTIEGAIQNASTEFGVPASLIHSVIQQESSMNPKAVSPSGAMGLMQLMPSTAEALGVSDPFDISSNVTGGTRYLKQLITQFNGNWTLALAAYNAGPEAVAKYAGIPPYPETEQYVQQVLARAGQSG